MQKYYIRHKISKNDIVHLSDSDSALIISRKLHKEEDFIELGSPSGVFLAQITFIAPASVEAEIIDKISSDTSMYEEPGLKVTIIQALTNDTKFHYFLEKAVEIGVDRIIPVETEYSLVKKAQTGKRITPWNNILKEATEQSRNECPPVLEKPITLEELHIEKAEKQKRIALSTEAINRKNIEKVIDKNTLEYVVAIGPVRGWSSKDLEILEKNGFEFVELRGNILRTETAGLVIATIIKYENGKL